MTVGIIAVATLTVGVAGCGGSSTSSTASGNPSNAANSTKLPTVKLMVGGIDKQIYLPYQLAQGLGYYKKYGVNVELSTESNGGVGAEDAVASGQVDMAGAWYEHDRTGRRRSHLRAGRHPARNPDPRLRDGRGR